jgi:CheY-like chemotaxis protein
VFEVAIAAPLPPAAAWLACAPAPSRPALSSEGRDPLAHRLSGHVLLAEDGRDNQTLICAFLRSLGLTYEVVGDGAAAVQAALAGDFDLVLMDIQMPVMDGVCATEVLRGAGYARPIVALTANIMAEDLQRYAEAGIDSTVGKPVNVAEFVQTLDSMLGAGNAAGAVAAFEELEGYKEIQASFQASLQGRLDELAASVGQERWGEVAALAHRLRGAAGTFGFPGVTRAAAQLEAAALQCNRQQARSAFAHMLALEELERVNTAGAVRWAM